MPFPLPLCLQPPCGSQFTRGMCVLIHSVRLILDRLGEQELLSVTETGQARYVSLLTLFPSALPLASSLRFGRGGFGLEVGSADWR